MGAFLSVLLVNIAGSFGVNTAIATAIAKAVFAGKTVAQIMKIGAGLGVGTVIISAILALGVHALAKKFANVDALAAW